MQPLGRLDNYLAEGRLKGAAQLIDGMRSPTRAHQVVRLHLEMQIGDRQAARVKAEQLLAKDLTRLQHIVCLDIVGHVAATRGETAGGIRSLRLAKQMATDARDKVLEARQQASLIEALLHQVGLEPASFELPVLRRLTVEAGDPFASIEFHLLAAELAFLCKQSHRYGSHINTADGLLERHPNLVQLARLKILKGNIASFLSSPQEAFDYAQEACALSEESGSIGTLIPSLGNLAHVCLVMGRFRDCREYLARVRSYIRKGGGGEIALRDTELQLELASGHEEKADELIEVLDQLSDRLEGGESYHGLWYLLTRIQWLFRRGRTHEGTQLALGAIPRVEQQADRHLLQRLRLLGSDGLAQIGRSEDGASMLAESVLASANAPLEMIAEASRVAGRIAGRSDSSAAASHFRRAARVLWIVGNRAEHGEVVRTATETLELDGTASEEELTGLFAKTQATASGRVGQDEPQRLIRNTGNLVARAAEGVAAAIDLATHPALLGYELAQLIVDSDSASTAALIETFTGKRNEVLAWFGCDVDRASGLPDEPGVIRVPLGTGHGRTCEIAVAPPASPSARRTLLAIERLARAALELHHARERERDQAALWPEETVEQQLGMVIASEAMTELVATMRRVATANVTVLITGETGTGKELLARALHQSSLRRDGPFVPFNCTAVARDMIDAQLFGYRRGAFTGAHEAFPGVIRAAAGGTLFLDEIGEVGADVQPKLLRFLESGEVHPLGEPRPTSVDVRIVAATNANVDQLVRDGRFREDLFYRLDVIRLHIPPLRERREEIPLLVEHFLAKHARDSKKSGLGVAEETMEYLVLYRWPGNVRQLANEMHRLVALAESGAVLMPEHLSREIATSRRTVPASERELAPTELVVRIDQPMSAAAEHLERAMIQHAMRKADGRVEDAARILGLSRKGLYLKRQRFGIE